MGIDSIRKLFSNSMKTINTLLLQELSIYLTSLLLKFIIMERTNCDNVLIKSELGSHFKQFCYLLQK